MTRGEAKKIAEYALPRLLGGLPKEMRAILVLQKGEDKKTAMERLTHKLASDIQWIASDIEAREEAKYV